MTKSGASPSQPSTALAAHTPPLATRAISPTARRASDTTKGLTPTASQALASTPVVPVSGHWIVDPGAAKQSQDWIYAGPAARQPSRKHTSVWLGAAALSAAIVCLAVALALVWPAMLAGPRAVLDATGRHPVAAGLVAASALYATTALASAARHLARRRGRGKGPALEPPADTMTFTEASEASEASEAHRDAPIGYASQESDPPSDETWKLSAYAAPGDPVAWGGSQNQAEDAALTDEEAATRQAWEGKIDEHPPTRWPDRPLLLAIADGVGSGLRPAEMARLATRIVWHRTYYHLHSLASGAPPSAREPWLIAPQAWPPAGPVREELLIRAMCRAFADANAAVIARGTDYRRLDPAETRSAATTLSVLAVDGAACFLVHVGDCSVHHVSASAGTVEARQVEHNRAAAYAQGDPARYAEARRKGLHNVLTRWLGMSHEWRILDPYVARHAFELAAGDSLVLCSDGLDKHVLATEIARTAIALPSRRAARRLVDLANERGGSDHIAVAVLQAGGIDARTRRVGRRAVWVEDARRAIMRRRGDVLGLTLAGFAAATVGWGILSFASYGAPDSAPPPAATATPLAGASPVPDAAAVSEPTPALQTAPAE